MGRYVKYKDSKGLYRFRLECDEGKELFVSKGFSTKDILNKSLKSSRLCWRRTNCFVKKTSPDKRFLFALRCQNGITVGASPLYDTREEMMKTLELTLKHSSSLYEIIPHLERENFKPL